MPSSTSWCLLAVCALVQMPMASCNGCGDPSNRMNGTIAAPSDDHSFTMLVGRTTFRVPRNARFTDGGGGNYAGYLMHYQTFGGKSLHDYIQEQVPSYNRAENSQHGEAEFDEAKHRALLTYDEYDMRHMEFYQDLQDGGGLMFEADYKPGAKEYAASALKALMDDVIPVRPGETIAQGMGMGNSVLARTILNDEIANAYLEIPLPGYPPGDRSGLRLEIDSDMMPGPSGDDLAATCRSGQLSQYDAGKSFKNGEPDPYVTELLRYRERRVADIPGEETVELETAKDGSYRETTFTYMTNLDYPVAGQPALTIRATTERQTKSDDLRQTLAAWDAILASATVVPMSAPARGIFGSSPPGYKQLPPCRSHPDINLAGLSSRAHP